MIKKRAHRKAPKQGPRSSLFCQRLPLRRELFKESDAAQAVSWVDKEIPLVVHMRGTVNFYFERKYYFFLRIYACGVI